MKPRGLIWLLVVAALFLLPFLAQAQELQVHDAAIATFIEDRMPQGVGETFPADVGKLYAFTRIVGAEAETTVTHKWYHGDQLMAEITLPVRSNNWRTWSSKNIWQGWTGQWRVDVVGPDGTVLKSITFTIQ
ncbi:DUF2914 domain-containing protein [Dissulfurirhabdus thermomarina]|uniref:DUF2914 domain-containing protein n=1 Tax=Dissulfurirhabdus thermomarina TaxID=1765737 RepID=A0A6N9TQL1_DISTH|nr:DUF2914 domain-containing protein [Dissulfurirhabdus thermomarina]NDY42740.1 DUF2914 domain-containing protein [Dissulfurirhabdus thermomarina]NMX22458.1 DUF2914 domain-containing protein [Dissulfurirhabdus thermomarina]